MTVSFLDGLQKLFGFGRYSKWKKGLLKILISREDSKEKFEKLFPDDQDRVDEALRTFCDAMDIKKIQRYKLHPSDKIIEIYKAVRISESTDDMEIERLWVAIKDSKRKKMDDWFSKEKTVQDWVSLWISE